MAASRILPASPDVQANSTSCSLGGSSEKGCSFALSSDTEILLQRKVRSEGALSIDCNYVKEYICNMAPRAKIWSGPEEAEGHKVTMVWPKTLWREIQHLALEEDTSATALMIEAAQMMLASRKEVRAEQKGKKTRKP